MDYRFRGGPYRDMPYATRADKDRQTACMQDRVLGDVSWTRGKCQRHECRSQQADVHGFEPPPSSNTQRGKMELVLLLSQTSRTPALSRALAPRNVDGTRPPDQRWASADLSQGPAYKSRPGLFTRQGPNRGAGLRQADRQTCRAVSVSRDRQRLRRFLSCLPASKPDFSTPSFQFLSL